MPPLLREVPMGERERVAIERNREIDRKLYERERERQTEKRTPR